MVEFHRENGWQAAISQRDGVWQHARGVKEITTFDHLIGVDPTQISRLSALMQRMQSERPHWTQWFPEEVIFPTGVDEGGAFVDVGGGRGHDLLALAKQYPHRASRFILQDLQSVSEEVDSSDDTQKDPRMTVMAHDFFQEQPVRGARTYYMHKIMHDWPDQGCVPILTHLRNAMDADSRIFINDVIVPDQGASVL